MHATPPQRRRAPPDATAPTNALDKHRNTKRHSAEGRPTDGAEDGRQMYIYVPTTDSENEDGQVENTVHCTLQVLCVRPIQIKYTVVIQCLPALQVIFPCRFLTSGQKPF